MSLRQIRLILTQFAHMTCLGISLNNVGAIISMKYSYRLIHSCEVYFCCLSENIGAGSDLD